MDRMDHTDGLGQSDCETWRRGDSDKNVTLVASLENGAGKSTLLVHALYYVLFDKAYRDGDKKSSLAGGESYSQISGVAGLWMNIAGSRDDPFSDPSTLVIVECSFDGAGAGDAHPLVVVRVERHRQGLESIGSDFTAIGAKDKLLRASCK